MKFFISVLFLFMVYFTHAQYPVFKYIESAPLNTPNVNDYYDNITAKNKACRDFIFQFQNEILDIILVHEIANFKTAQE